MKIVVVYESLFGNTMKIAEAVAEGLAGAGPVTTVEIGELDLEVLEGVDLLVVGGPTHAHGMSRSMTREAARKTAPNEPHLSRGGGLRDGLARFPRVDGVDAAAFDTRFDRSIAFVGSAARGFARILRGRGYRLVAVPESFFVADTEGPLLDGELDRARAWGAGLLGGIERKSA